MAGGFSLAGCRKQIVNVNALKSISISPGLQGFHALDKFGRKD
jgi:hypothetical protein